MQYKITIPEPCRQSWDNMLPDATGRFCNSCQKSVVDFTAMADEEIQQYFIQHHNKPVCGHFKNSQIQRIVIDLPKNIFSIQMPIWMQFLVACLIIFGISIFPFETTIAGKPVTEISFYQGDTVLNKTDTLHKIKKSLRPDEAIDTGTYVDGMIMSIPIIHSSKKVKVTADSTIKCKPQDSMKADIVIDSKIPEQKKISSSSNTSAQMILPGITATEGEKHSGPTPYIPTGFILPSVLLFRRKNSNNPMD